jgi:hypothetical protein
MSTLGDSTDVNPVIKFLPQTCNAQYSSRDGHAEGEHVNRGGDAPSFCPNLQVLDMSTLGDAADVNTVIKFLPHTCIALCGRNLITVLTSAASPRIGWTIEHL